MKIGSLFDGSGGFPLAGSLCGITPAFASEVEPYPIAVTTNRVPNMRHLGDISKINGATIDPVHIITFGSPCQDLSTAGRRAGLKHEAHGDDETTRSGLFMEAVRIIKEMRIATNGEYPKFAIWENVPGAFSSNKGEDFGIVLEELIKICEPQAPEIPSPSKKGWPYADCIVGDGWSLAWRVLNAQHWGVPHRRRRIYLVLDLSGERAGEILFKRKGLCGYFEKGGTPWKRNAGEVAYRSGADNSERVAEEQSSLTESTKFLGPEPESIGEEVISVDQGGGKSGAHSYIDFAPTLTCTHGGEPVVSYGETFILDNIGGQAEYGKSSNVNGTLRSARTGAIAYESRSMVFENHSQDSRYKGPVETAPTMSAKFGTGGNNQPFVVTPESKVYCKSRRAKTPDDYTTWKDGEVANTLNTFDQGEARANELVIEPIPIHDQATRAYGKRGERSDGKGNGIGIGQPGNPMNTLTAGDRHAVGYDAAIVCTMENFMGIGEDISPTLKSRDWKDPHAVCYGLDRASFNQGENAKFGFSILPEQQPTITARGPGAVTHKGNGESESVNYIVRRLTPTECARLQGFPDTWGHIPKKESLTDEEYSFWLDVRNTHSKINGRATKEYTKAQMLTWYNKLHSDSSEYKMWGNGIALPNALYVMQGIAEALRQG